MARTRPIVVRTSPCPVCGAITRHPCELLNAQDVRTGALALCWGCETVLVFTADASELGTWVLSVAPQCRVDAARDGILFAIDHMRQTMPAPPVAG